MAQPIIFATYFPEFQNVHLSKEAGKIPYILHRDHKYISWVLSNKNGEYPALNTEARGLNIHFLKKKWSKIPEKIYQILVNFSPGSKNSLKMSRLASFAFYITIFTSILENFRLLVGQFRQINVLQIYHSTFRSLLIGIIYRFFNKSGTLILRMDENPGIIENFARDQKTLLNSTRNRYWMERAAFDVITVETRSLSRFLRNFHPLFKFFSKNIHYVKDGIDVEILSREIPENFNLKQKKNIILHVARIGTPQKRSDIILNAFTAICKRFPAWKLVLIGSIEPAFQNQLLNAVHAHPEQVQYAGVISDRKILYNYYKESKLIALPSKAESFGFAAAEGGFFGDVLIGSDIPSFKEMTSSGELSYLSPVNDLQAFTRNLEYILSHPEELEKKADGIMKYIRENYDWKQICTDLNQYIREAQNSYSLKGGT